MAQITIRVALHMVLLIPMVPQQIITHSNTQVEVELEEFQVRLAAILTWKHLLNLR